MISQNVEAVRRAAQLALQLAEQLVAQLAVSGTRQQNVLSTWKRRGRSARFRRAAASDAANSSASCSRGDKALMRAAEQPARQFCSQLYNYRPDESE